MRFRLAALFVLSCLLLIFGCGDSGEDGNGNGGADTSSSDASPPTSKDHDLIHIALMPKLWDELELDLRQRAWMSAAAKRVIGSVTVEKVSESILPMEVRRELVEKAMAESAGMVDRTITSSQKNQFNSIKRSAGLAPIQLERGLKISFTEYGLADFAKKLNIRVPKGDDAWGNVLRTMHHRSALVDESVKSNDDAIMLIEEGYDEVAKIGMKYLAEKSEVDESKRAQVVKRALWWSRRDDGQWMPISDVLVKWAGPGDVDALLPAVAGTDARKEYRIDQNKILLWIGQHRPEALADLITKYPEDRRFTNMVGSALGRVPFEKTEALWAELVKSPQEQVKKIAIHHLRHNKREDLIPK